jgi:tetratricopeptide (TPR) repeat protein
MNNRFSTYLLRALLFSLLIIISLDISCKNSRTYPHILLITIDGLRPDHLSCYGYQKIKTPNIDRIAEQGVRFENGITPSPLTLPGHASLFTGLYPYQHGLRCEKKMKLDENFETLAEILRNKNYETAAVAGSSLLHHQYGLDQGFQDYADEFSEGLYFNRQDLKLKGSDVTIRGIKRLQARLKPRPMFLWVNYADLIQVEPKRYDLMLKYIDAQIGNLVMEIPEDRHALILITSLYAAELKNNGIIEAGYSLKEDVIRVPLIISGHGLPKAKTIAGNASILGIMPFILEIAGVKKPSQTNHTSLLEAVQRGQAPSNKIYVSNLEPYCSMGWKGLQAIYDGDKISAQIDYNLFPDPDRLYFKENPAITQPEPEQKHEIIKMIRNAQENILKKEYEKAENILKDVLVKDPHNMSAILELAWIYFHSDKISQAREMFFQMKEIRENDPRAVIGIAACCLEENDLDSAQNLFATLKGFPVLLPEYYFYYGKFLKQTSELEKATESLEQAVSLDPLNKESQLLLGETLAEQGKTREALNHLERAIAIDPDCLEAYKELERIHSKILHNEIKAQAYREKINSLIKKRSNSR